MESSLSEEPEKISEMWSWQRALSVCCVLSRDSFTKPVLLGNIMNESHIGRSTENVLEIDIFFKK